MQVNIENKPVRSVGFYRFKNHCPVEDFLETLPAKTAKKVVWVLNLIEDLPVIPRQYFKKLTATKGIWECRIKVGNNIYRVFAFWDRNNVILTHGIMKKTQKLSKQEIHRAEKMKQEYFKEKR
ncbi:type II toxin-antitoxin system RelE/ParE family toxin [bacterium]|nr:type II toxin-antitoxin system RelE/ParE family toxin [bacterium]